jgi:Flp pilus assembly protein TadD
MGSKSFLGMIKMRGIVGFFAALACLYGQDELKRGEDLYQKTDYKASIAAVHVLLPPNAAVFNLIGRDHFMLGEYKKATESFHKALALEPKNSVHAHWLGRAYGRRAETSLPFAAPMHASKARQYFEQAVSLDPTNDEALNDLFDYYLQAPGFLGGGFEKAQQVAAQIAKLNEAEGYFARAQLADKQKQFDTAEAQLRRAMELAPRQVGRIVDLARYLSKRGRYQESDAAFDKAQKVAPNEPKVIFARAHTYIEEKRNLDKAKNLLIQYLQSDLTPEDPPREHAEKLLKQVSGS